MGIKIATVALLFFLTAFWVGCRGEELTALPATAAPEATPSEVSAQESQEVEELLKAALALYGQGQSREAITRFDEALRLNPDDARAYTGRGLAYDHLGDFQKALQDFDAAIRLNPQDAGAYAIRGLAYAHLGDPDKALQDFDAALRLNPQLADAYHNRGVVYFGQGNFQLAARDLGQAFRLDPQRTEGRDLLVQSQEELRDAQTKKDAQASGAGGGLVSPGVPNRPPQVGDVTAYPVTVHPEQEVGLTGEASDPDGNALTYRWLLGGDLLGTGQSFNWKAPQPDGEYTVTLEVSDGDQTATGSVSVNVVNLRPEILGVTYQAITSGRAAPVNYLLQRVTEYAGEAVAPWSLRLSVEAMDPNGDPLSYQWSQPSGVPGTFSDPGIAAPTWTPPRVDADTTVALIITVGEVREGRNSTPKEVEVQIVLSGARLSVDKPRGTPPLAVSFTAEPFPEGLAVQEYRWDFDGDGVTDHAAGDPTATFTYTQQGTFVPMLTTWDADGSIIGAGERKEITVRPPLALAASKPQVLAGERGEISVSGLTPEGQLTMATCDPSGKCQSSTSAADGEGKFAESISSLDLPGVHTQKVTDQTTGKSVGGSITVVCREGYKEAGDKCTQAANTVLLAQLLSEEFGKGEVISLKRIAGGYTADADAGCSTDHLHAGFPPTLQPAPGAPHAFAGTATIAGVPAADGTVVTAWVADFQEPVGEGVMGGGIYTLKVFQYGSASFAGKTVTFKIGGIDANETATWQSLSADELNLTASSIVTTPGGLPSTGITIRRQGPIIETTPGGLPSTGITIDAKGPFSEPDPAGCGYGKVLR